MNARRWLSDRNRIESNGKPLIATVDIPFLLVGLENNALGRGQCLERCRVLRTVVVFTSAKESERNGGGWERNERGGAGKKSTVETRNDGETRSSVPLIYRFTNQQLLGTGMKETVMGGA